MYGRDMGRVARAGLAAWGAVEEFAPGGGVDLDVVAAVGEADFDGAAEDLGEGLVLQDLCGGACRRRRALT